MKTIGTQKGGQIHLYGHTTEDKLREWQVNRHRHNVNWKRKTELILRIVKNNAK